MSLAADNKGYQSPTASKHNSTAASNHQDYDDNTQTEYAVIRDVHLPELNPTNAIQRGSTQLKRWIVILLICIVICMLLSATAVAVSLVYVITLPGTTDGVTPTIAVSIDCVNAINFTENWRRDAEGRGILPRNDAANCDTIRLNNAGQPWFRFTGVAGNQMLNTCPDPNGSCGTHGAMWTDQPMPAVVGEQAVIDVYGSWNKNCKEFRYLISVMRCSLTDVIYKYSGDDSCSRGFCGMA